MSLYKKPYTILPPMNDILFHNMQKVTMKIKNP